MVAGQQPPVPTGLTAVMKGYGTDPIALSALLGMSVIWLLSPHASPKDVVQDRVTGGGNEKGIALPGSAGPQASPPSPDPGGCP